MQKKEKFPTVTSQQFAILRARAKNTKDPKLIALTENWLDNVQCCGVGPVSEMMIIRLIETGTALLAYSLKEKGK